MFLKKMWKKGKLSRILIVAVVILITAIIGVLIADAINELNVRFVPDYEKVDLSRFEGMRVENLTEEDYALIFRQTGLGRPAVHAIFNEPHLNHFGLLEIHQWNFFNPPTYICNRITPVTGEERLFWDEETLKAGFILADVRDGDIFITRSTHTLGWRHGHAGMVVDEVRGYTLEAAMIGTPSNIQNMSHWQTYATFIQLRIRTEGIGEKAAEFALENLVDIRYDLFAGLFPRFEDVIRSTQCAHLPWFAFMQFGYDLDPNGIWPVTPRGLVNSEYVEIVQIFGVNPDRPW